MGYYSNHSLDSTSVTGSKHINTLMSKQDMSNQRGNRGSKMLGHLSIQLSSDTGGFAPGKLSLLLWMLRCHFIGCFGYWKVSRCDMTKAITTMFVTGLVLLYLPRPCPGLTVGTRRQRRGAWCRAQLGSTTDLQTHKLSQYCALYTVEISWLFVTDQVLMQ